MTIGLTLKNQAFAWSHPLVAGLLLASVAILALFFWAEARATNPLLPLSLLNRSQVLLLLLANAPLTAMWFARVSFSLIIRGIRRVDCRYTSSRSTYRSCGAWIRYRPVRLLFRLQL